nr:hypothetical protein [Tanacetum cinerariifolium]
QNEDEDDDFEELYVADEIIDKLVSLANTLDDNTYVSAASSLQVFTIFADKMVSLVPIMVADAFEERMHGLIFYTLKNILPQLLNDSVKKLMPKIDKRVKKTLTAKVPEVLLKPLYKEFNALSKLESKRFVILEKKLKKSIHKKLIKYIKQMLHSTVKVPRDILVVNAQHLQTKVEKTSADLHELVEVVCKLVRIVNSVAPPVNTATGGEKESYAQPDLSM